MLRDDEVPIKLSDFERARHGICRLTTALEAVDADLADRGDYFAVFRHLYQVASDLRGFELAVAVQ